MEIKVCIDNDVISSNTETSTRADELIMGKSTLSCTHNPSFIGFFKKIVPLLSERRNVELKHTVSEEGEGIVWVTILSNSVTSSVFDIFKNIGIYMPKLTVGVSESTHTIYISSKLCRDLNKYSDAQRSAIVMYLLTLVHFINKMEEQCVVCKFDGISSSIIFADDADTLLKCIRTFEAEETWYVKDSNKDTYSSVKYYNSAYSYVNVQYASTDAVRVGIVKSKTGKTAGVAAVAMGKTLYTFVVNGNKVYTDFDLCNIEMSPDSVCAYIANSFVMPTEMCRTDNIPLSKEMEFLEFDGDSFSEFSKTEKLSKPLAGWMLGMLSKGAIIADIEDLNKLCKKYGVRLPAGAEAEVTLSCEEMRKLYDSDAYAQELYKQIKPYYDTYDIGDKLTANLKGFSNGAIYAMLFIGDSGTGKSTSARVIPARCGIPYISVNCSVNIEESDLFGAMKPNACKSKPEDPEFVWEDGVITKAIRNGYCVILEEINFARPGVLGKLNSLLDETRQIDLPYEIVRAHPNFRVIATCNIAYEGTNRFNKALVNRFDDVTIFTDLPRNQAIDIIKKRTGYSNITKISKVYDVYETLKKYATEQGINITVSIRQLLNIFTKGKYYSNATDAVQRIMLNGAFIENEEYQKVFEDTVFSAFDLKFKI